MPRESRRLRPAGHPRNLAAIGAALLLCSSFPPSTNAQVPGLVYTESGYDNVDGLDPICWWAFAEGDDDRDEESDSFDGKNWRNDLVPSFVSGPTNMMPACPDGLDLRVDAPLDFVLGESLRTGESYDYHVVGKISLDGLRDRFGLSSDSFFHSAVGTPSVAIKLLFCPVNGNFCSPFSFSTKEDSDDPEQDDSDDSEEEDSDDREEFMGAKPHETATRFVRFRNATQNVFEFDLKAAVVMDNPGAFLPLGSVLFFLTNETINGQESGSDGNVAMKCDMANVLHQRVVNYKNPPKINVVDTAVEILSYVIIGFVALLESSLLFAVAKHRNHSVIKLSQGTFLILFLGAAVVASACSFLINPKSDIYCKLFGPLVMIPLQLMLAIVIGRLRRITSIMLPLMAWQSETTANSGSRISRIQTMVPEWARFSKGGSSGSGTSSATQSDKNSDSPPDNPQRRRLCNLIPKPPHPPKRSLRTEFTKRRLWMWVIGITLPQIIVQAVGLAVFPMTRNLELNKEESMGRWDCQCESFDEYMIVQYGVLFLTILFLLFESQQSRNLPSLFNEAKLLSSALITMIIILVLGVVVFSVMDDPTASPDALYIISVAIVLCLTLNLSLRLVFPKLKLIWKGEKIMVSKLLDDHKKKQRDKATRRLRRPSGVRPSVRQTVDCQRILGPVKEDEERKADEEGNAAAIETALPAEEGAKHFSKSNVESDLTVENSDDAEQENDSGAQSKPRPSRKSTFSNDEIPPQYGRRNKKDVSFLESRENTVSSEHTPMIINSSAAPPSRIMASIIEHTELMSRVNSRILSGLQVPRDDWKSVQASLERMNLMFKNQIQFSWDEDGEADGNLSRHGVDV